MRKLSLSCFAIVIIIIAAARWREALLRSTEDPIYGCAICPPPRGSKPERKRLHLENWVSKDIAARFGIFSSESLRINQTPPASTAFALTSVDPI